MKRVKLNLKYVVIFLVSVTFFSCSPEDGEDGVMGLPGQDGINGIDGQDGADGTDGQDGSDGADGADGNDTIFSSEWIDSGFSETPTVLQGFFRVTDDRFSSSVVNSGVVLVYGMRLFDEAVEPIPFTEGVIAYSYNMEPNSATGTFPNITLETGSITFIAKSSDFSSNIYDRYSQFRYVIIPPTTTARSSTLNFEKMSYEEVVDHFGLEY